MCNLGQVTWPYIFHWKWVDNTSFLLAFFYLPFQTGSSLGYRLRPQFNDIINLLSSIESKHFVTEWCETPSLDRLSLLGQSCHFWWLCTSDLYAGWDITPCTTQRVWFMKQFKTKKAQGPAVCSLSFSVLALTRDSCEVGWISEQIQLKRNSTPSLQKMVIFCSQPNAWSLMLSLGRRWGCKAWEGRWNRTADAQIFSKSVKSFAICSLWPM